jgi:glycosyltransferase involved in cell wall biosynthesis
MGNFPLVSVLMTAYNRERYIAEAIASVLCSSYQNLELIIVDDGSKDDTVKIAQDYAQRDNRIKLFINEKNLGDYPNRNEAISYATGKYFMFCDSDDTLLPESISKIVNLAEADDKFNFALSWAPIKKPTILSSEEALKKHFFEEQFLYIGPGGTFMRKGFIEEKGKYPVKYGPANDMYFNLKVACNTSILLFPFDLMIYREHEGQEIKNPFGYLHNNFRYMQDALEELPLPFSAKQIGWLKKKNYRRFVVNLYNYYRETRNYKNTIKAWKMAGFNYQYFLRGIFH